MNKINLDEMMGKLEPSPIETGKQPSVDGALYGSRIEGDTYIILMDLGDYGIDENDEYTRVTYDVRFILRDSVNKDDAYVQNTNKYVIMNVMATVADACKSFLDDAFMLEDLKHLDSIQLSFSGSTPKRLSVYKRILGKLLNGDMFDEYNSGIVEDTKDRLVIEFERQESLVESTSQKIERMFVENELFESPEHNLGTAASILRGDDKSKEAKEESKAKVKELADKTTEAYVDKPSKEGGDHQDLPALVKWMVDGSSIQNISRIYKEYMDTPELRKKLLVKKFPNADVFMQKLHSVKSSLLPKDDSGGENQKDLKPKESLEHAKRYEDENIKIYLGTDEETTRELSCYNKYGLCIGGKGGSNWFARYRYESEQSTYFAHFKNENPEAKAGFIIIDINSDGEYLWNEVLPKDGSAQYDHPTSEKELLSRYPDLAPAFEKDIFKYIPPTEGEEEDYSIVSLAEFEGGILSFYKNKDSYSSPVKYVEYMINYAKHGFDIGKTEWSEIQKIVDTKTFSIILKSFVEHGEVHLPDEIFNRLKDEDKERYWNDGRKRQAYFYVKKHGLDSAPEAVQQAAIQRMVTSPFDGSDFVIKFGWAAAPAEVQKAAIAFMDVLPKYSYQYVINHGLDSAPESIQQNAIKYLVSTPDKAYEYVQERGLDSAPEAVQQPAIKYMTKVAIAAYTYIYKYGLDSAPEAVQQSAIKYMVLNPRLADNYVTIRRFKSSPEAVQRAAIEYMVLNPARSYSYVNMRGFDSAPEAVQQTVIKHMVSDPEYAVDYIIENGFDSAPESVQQMAIKEMIEHPNSHYAVDYITNYGFDSAPEVVQQIALKYMVSHSHASYEYVQEHGLDLAPGAVQQAAIQHMTSKPDRASEYIKTHGTEGLPPELVQQLTESTTQKIVRMFVESFSVQPYDFHSSDQYTDYEDNDEEFYTFSLNGVNYVAEVDWRVNKEYNPPRIVECLFGVKDEEGDIDDFDDNILVNKVDPTDVIATIFDIVVKGLEKRQWTDFHLVMGPKFIEGEDVEDALGSRRGAFYQRAVERLIKRKGVWDIVDRGTKMDDQGEEIIYFTMRKKL